MDHRTGQALHRLERDLLATDALRVRQTFGYVSWPLRRSWVALCWTLAAGPARSWRARCCAACPRERSI